MRLRSAPSGRRHLKSIGPALVLLAAMVLAACDGRGTPSRTGTQPVVIRDVTVIDVVSGALLPHTTVVIVGRRIADMGPVPAIGVPRGAQVIDGATGF